MKKESFSKGDRVKIRTRFHPSIFDGVTGMDTIAFVSITPYKVQKGQCSHRIFSRLTS